MVEVINTRKQLWTGAAVLLVLQLGYMLLWWNKGIQLNSTGLPTLTSLSLLAGRMPYRDFHYWCPPGHLLIYTALTALFGDGLIYARAWALVERISIFLLMYFWLARVYSARAAFFGTLAAGVGFSSDMADAIAHYDFDALLATVAAGYAASIAMTSASRWSRACYFVAGFCAGCCMLFKQTQGVGLFPAILLIFAFGDRARSVALRLRTIAEYVLGWTIPTGLTALWLINGDAWRGFVKQNFLEGTSSKGPLVSILLRPLILPFSDRPLGLALMIAFLLIGVSAFLARRDVPAASGTGNAWVIWALSFAALCFGCGAAFWGPHMETQFQLQRALVEVSVVCIFLSLFGSVALALWYSWAALTRTLDVRNLQICILAAVSAEAAYMFSVSFAAYEKMLIPGFAFVMTLALDSPSCRRIKWREFAVVGLGLILISGAAVRKLTWPYAWENWVDGPVKSETVAANLPELRGLRMTARSAEFLEHVTQTIDAHSRPEDKIFVYPNYALFYVLAHREPGVFAYMHWFDIVSDGLVREDEARVREHPPAVIVSVEMPESTMHRMETRFRNGALSGQREMLTLIHDLPGYKLVESIPIPYQDFPLNIYVRD